MNETFEDFLKQGARQPSVITEERTRGTGCVAMVWQNGVLLRVAFGIDALETRKRALAAAGYGLEEMTAVELVGRARR